MSPFEKEKAYSLHRLFRLVERLRGPEGCPWDQEQTVDDLRAYLLEEAHEVAAAIDRGDWQEIADESGDLLFQIVFLASLAEEQAELSFTEVVDRIEAKMIARHPHVFGEEQLADSAAVHRAWERRKLEGSQAGASHLSGVPESLPALLAAYRMGQKAAGVGFDWPDAEAVLAKVDEELAELRTELDPGSSAVDSSRVAAELGDLLLTLASLARHLGLDPEAALAGANARFRRRFQQMERQLAANGESLANLDLAAMESAWNDAKRTDPD